ncbi:MAG: HAD family hydrolase [Shimia sp.]
MGKPIEIVAFDADDTLWENEGYFRLTEERFAALLAPYAPDDDLRARLLAVERRNLAQYGYGVRSFVLSMIETAIEVSDGRVPASVVQTILDEGRRILGHPVELLPGAREAVEAIVGPRRIVVTKGDLLHQEGKVAASGLGALFDAVHIVSEKTAETYAALFPDPDRSVMVGNSVRSDVLPALEAGAWAVHVPAPITWAHEEAAPPIRHPRFRRIDSLSELPALLAALA